jgi:hypothetical protein
VNRRKQLVSLLAKNPHITVEQATCEANRILAGRGDARQLKRLTFETESKRAMQKSRAWQKRRNRLVDRLLENDPHMLRRDALRAANKIMRRGC